MTPEQAEQLMLQKYEQLDKVAAETYNQLLHKHNGKPCIIHKPDRERTPYHQRTRKRIIITNAEGIESDVLETISAIKDKYKVHYVDARNALINNGWLFIPALGDCKLKYEE